MLHSRMKRVEEVYQQEVARILAYDLQDPRVRMVTPVGVKISKDLSEAIIHVSIFSDDPDEARETMAALEAAKGFIKHLLATRLDLKRLPEPHFKQDSSIGEAFKIFHLIDQARDEDSEHPPREDEEGEEKENEEPEK
ncbi:30S ribosome-binding factor RbfA [bacterium]|nr:30S ribosome-binding factor RbfA [bacterium]